MKLGLLGLDSRIAAVLRSAISRGDSLAVVCDVTPLVAQMCGLDESVPRDTSWQPLLDHQQCDAVLVGADGWSDERAAGVRALVQAGRTLLLSQPLVISMLWAYELDMIRRDTGARLIPLLPNRLHPFIARLRARIEGSLAGGDPSGPIEQLLLERRMPDRSKDAVLAALARDVDLIHVLTGDPSRLSTLGAGDTPAVWGTLAVGFTGASQVPARWQTCRGDEHGLTITLTDASGCCTIDIPDDASRPWIWAGEGGESLPFDAASVVVDQLHGRCATTDVPEPSWTDAARALELAETVPRSLTRGRSIDLHQEEFSELGTFRGTMASLGCALVLATLLILLLATLVGGIARATGWRFGELIASVWPQAVLAILGLFLALQILPLVVAPAGRNRRPPGPGPE